MGACSSDVLRSVEVWRAILLHTQMPVTAMIRNLVRMTILGLLQPDSYEENVFCTRLENSSILEQASFPCAYSTFCVQKGKPEKQRGRRHSMGCECKSCAGAFGGYLKNTPSPTLLVALDTTSGMAKNIESSWVTIKMAAATLAFQIHCCAPKSKVITFSTTTEDLDFQVNRIVFSILKK